MLILHANWSDGALSVWAEALEAYVSEPGAVGVEADGGPATAVAAPALAHPFTVPAETVIDALVARSVVTDAGELVPVRKRLRLPSNGQPKPSARLAGLVSAADSIDLPTLQPWSVEAVQVPPDETLAMLLRLEDLGPDESIDLGHDLRFWIAVARFVIELLADQRFLPTLMQARGDDLRAAWLPWVHDEAGRERLGELLEAMPPACRAVDDGTDDPWTILDTALRVLTDATVRRALIADAFDEAIDGRDPGVDPHVAWLSCLLAREDDVNVGGLG